MNANTTVLATYRAHAAQARQAAQDMEDAREDHASMSELFATYGIDGTATLSIVESVAYAATQRYLALSLVADLARCATAFDWEK